MDRHPGETSLASPESAANSVSTVSSPNSRHSHTSSKTHMSDMKIGPAAVAASLADASRPVQLLRLSEHPKLRKNWQRGTSPEEVRRE